MTGELSQLTQLSTSISVVYIRQHQQQGSWKTRMSRAITEDPLTSCVVTLPCKIRVVEIGTDCSHGTKGITRGSMA